MQLLQGSFKITLERAQTLYISVTSEPLEVFGNKGVMAVFHYQGSEALVGQHAGGPNATESVIHSFDEGYEPVALEYDMSGADGNGKDLDVCGNETFENILPHAHIL